MSAGSDGEGGGGVTLLGGGGGGRRGALPLMLRGRCLYGLGVCLEAMGREGEKKEERGTVVEGKQKERAAQEALACLHDAADAGHVPACLHLGLFYLGTSSKPRHVCFAAFFPPSAYIACGRSRTTSQPSGRIYWS
jgi:hypothetical protein